ncbi:hypothetical protein NDU88_002883 [Pleurodeles waltl]|uniref:Uncharacterized protein n=1 Tax=Pleurodeles waltl TaxID=8319 RepID=A0AAV7M2Y3_PLEWA|nr:hypothetical protein NDU88_002883 [Pleurodeles waltl]
MAAGQGHTRHASRLSSAAASTADPALRDHATSKITAVSRADLELLSQDDGLRQGEQTLLCIAEEKKQAFTKLIGFYYESYSTYRNYELPGSDQVLYTLQIQDKLQQLKPNDIYLLVNEWWGGGELEALCLVCYAVLWSHSCLFEKRNALAVCFFLHPGRCSSAEGCTSPRVLDPGNGRTLFGQIVSKVGGA